MEIIVKIESEDDLLAARIILGGFINGEFTLACPDLVLGVVEVGKPGLELAKEFAPFLKAVDTYAACGFRKTAVFRNIDKPE